MQVTTTSEKVLEAASKCKQSKATLEILFPDVFDDDSPFCHINDVFIRKGQTGFYTVMYDMNDHTKNNTLRLYNISTHSKWSNSIPDPFSDIQGTVNYNLTKGQFKKLIGTYNIGDFIIIKVSKDGDLYKKINKDI